jgi:uncharacterized protein
MWDLVRKPRNTNIAFQGGRTTRNHRSESDLTPVMHATPQSRRLYGLADRGFSGLPLVAIAVTVVLAGTSLTAAAQPGNAAVDRTIEMVPMRDGIRLRTIIFHCTASGNEPGPTATPDGKQAVRAPTVLLRTPYNQDQPSLREQAERFARAGYVAITQDCRGRFGSEGQFVFYWGEGPDGFDTVEWIRRQPWSNRRVGMWGPSYMGSVQWLTAAEGTPLTALAPTAAANNFYYNLHVGGVYMLPMARMGFSMDLFGPATRIGSSPQWSEWYQFLPLTDWGKHLDRRLPWQEAMIAHELPDGFWKRADTSPAFERMDFPAQHIVGCFDFMCRDAVRSYQAMCRRAATEFARSHQQLILGPWDHGTGARKTGDVDFGPDAQLDVVGENLAWFNRFLKPQQPKAEPFPRVRYFSMGENRWREARSWPPPEAVETAFYFRSGGHANTRRGDGRLDRAGSVAEESVDTFRSDPANPVPSWPALGKEYREVWGPVDQQLVQDRDDVLVYRSDPLTESFSFAGSPRVELWVAADTPDADLVCKLVDVDSTGKSLPLATGVLRGSARDSELNRSPLVRGQTYPLVVDLGHAAARIDVGHRIAVQIAGTNFPVYARNLNTGEGPTGTRMLVSTEQVFHSAAKPSRLVLPKTNSRP